ncbi:MAG: dTDP-4-dehydrorhamnose 3,5-epimerase [Gammaproteobacteria bacterium]|nr:dTDP-4-dehydrorhamnose 3,5-epimerase [Gammaproteobacteria bacterium]
MKFINTQIQDVILIQPELIEDKRGFFMESYQIKKFKSNNITSVFVQDNYVKSIKNTLRGLHFQYKFPQAKLIRCLKGSIFDVAVDLREHSPSFGKWFGTELSENNKHQLFIPEGFAHGYCVLSDSAEITYKCSNIYYPEYENGVIWDDKDLGIIWPIKKPILSVKDSKLYKFKNLKKVF